MKTFLIDACLWMGSKLVAAAGFLIDGRGGVSKRLSPAAWAEKVCKKMPLPLMPVEKFELEKGRIAADVLVAGVLGKGDGEVFIGSCKPSLYGGPCDGHTMTEEVKMGTPVVLVEDRNTGVVCGYGRAEIRGGRQYYRFLCVVGRKGWGKEAGSRETRDASGE